MRRTDEETVRAPEPDLSRVSACRGSRLRSRRLAQGVSHARRNPRPGYASTPQAIGHSRWTGTNFWGFGRLPRTAFLTHWLLPAWRRFPISVGRTASRRPRRGLQHYSCRHSVVLFVEAAA